MFFRLAQFLTQPPDFIILPFDLRLLRLQTHVRFVPEIQHFMLRPARQITNFSL